MLRRSRRVMIFLLKPALVYPYGLKGNVCLKKNHIQRIIGCQPRKNTLQFRSRSAERGKENKKNNVLAAHPG